MLAMAACPASIAKAGQCLNDTSWKLSVQISTSFAFARRTANTFYSRTNGSLLTIANVSDPSPLNIQPTDLLFVLDRFFGDAPLAPNQTSTTLSLLNYVFNQVLPLQSPTRSSDGVLLLRSLLTVPVLWFQPNFMGGNISTTPIPTDIPRAGLPSELYTTAHWEKSNDRVVISLWTVIVFLALGTVIYVWCLALMTWAMSLQGPELSKFPLVDFASRIAAGRDLAKSPVDEIALAASGSGLKEKLQDVRLYLGDLTEQDVRDEIDSEGRSLKDRKIGFSTTEQVGRLRSGVKYT